MKRKVGSKKEKVLAIILISLVTIIMLFPILIGIFIYSLDWVSRPKGYQKFSGTFYDKNFNTSFKFDPYELNTQTKIDKNTYLFGKYLAGSTWTMYTAIVTNDIQKLDPAITNCLFNKDCPIAEPVQNIQVNGKEAKKFCRTYDYNKSFRENAIEKKLSHGTNREYCVLYIPDSISVVGTDPYGVKLIENIITTAKVN